MSEQTAAELERPAMIARIVPTHGRLVLPDVRCDFMWRRGRLLFCGPLTHGRASFATDEPLIVASFDPIMIRRWLDIPLKLVTDRIVPLGDVAPHLEAALGEQFFKGSMKAIGLPTNAIRICELNIPTLRGCHLITARWFGPRSRRLRGGVRAPA